MENKTAPAKAGLSPRRRRGAAIQVVFWGAVLLVLPRLLGASPVGEGFRSLAPVGWAMLLGGLALLWVFRDRAPPPPQVHVTPLAPRQAPPAMVIDTPKPVPQRPAIDIDLGAGVPRPDAVAEPSALQRTQLVRSQVWDKSLFEMMEWRRFEAVVEALFQQAGFQTGLQPHGAQDGVDIWLYSHSQTGGPVSVVQCKHGYGERVGPDTLQALRQSMQTHRLQRGQFATTASFTSEAVAFARKNGIHLLDADGLMALIAKRTPQQQQALLGLALG